MAKHAKPSTDNSQDRYPFIVRLYGVLSIIAGVVEIVFFVLALLAVIALLASGGSIDALAKATATTLVITLIDMGLSIVLAIMFVILGVRLLKGNRHKAALIANIMIGLETGSTICQMLLNGISTDLLPSFLSIIILLVLETYSDPALRDERRLHRRLRELEDRDRAEDGTLGRDVSGKGYITLNFYNLFWVFVVCSVLGLLLEEVWHMVIVDPGNYQDRAGMLYGPFSPIYGVGAAILTVVLNRFYDKNVLVVFLVSAVVGGAFEFFVSWFLETAFGIVAWDYTGTFLSIDGRTNGMFMAIWGVLGLTWVKLLLPYVLKLINMIPWNLRYVVTVIGAGFMLVNATLTLASFDCWFQRVGGTMDYENASAIVKFCNENYDNDFMEERFQSMDIHPDAAARS